MQESECEASLGPDQEAPELLEQADEVELLSLPGQRIIPAVDWPRGFWAHVVRQPALFIPTMFLVEDRKRKGIPENRSCLLEAHFVLAEILLSLVRIPLEAVLS